MRGLATTSLLTLALLLPASSAVAVSLQIGNTGGPLVATSGAPTNPDVAVNLGGTTAGTATPSALATTNALDGNGQDGTNAAIDLDTLGGGTGATPASATLDLFGNAGSGAGLDLGGGAAGDPTVVGDAGAGVGLGDDGVGSTGASRSAAFATLNGANGQCAGPSDAQLAHFVTLHNHGGIADWSQASNVRVQPVRACADVKARLAALLRADGHMQSVQAAAAADPLISASLDRSHRRAANVIAVDQVGRSLTVYVY